MAQNTEERPLVFVSVGTDHHGFDRLLRMMAEWARSHPDVTVLAQTGHTPSSEGLDAVAFMAPGELGDTLGRASAVVCHGGPSTIMEARAAGHIPIVVARDPQFGEHVDGHQLRFVGRIGDAGVIAGVQTADALASALDQALDAGPPDGPCPDRPEAQASIERIGTLLDGLITDHHVDRARGRR
jgi:UDP-N-acetylglucosamine transferase subunit ALG13